MIDSKFSLAMSMHSSKGVYALLLGSGVSRSAQIPTGWEIIVDLIRKIAYLDRADCEPDPEAWYVEQYGEAPNYSKLLEANAKTSSERNFLLRRYIEPTEEEREQRVKVPTAAHYAIAKLVASGYIKMILTTNFDHLLEDALRAIGIEPQVISKPGAIEGAMPFVHERCTIVKLHGDYLDPLFKNTTSELEVYDDRLNRYLDRILDEFGLIVCGWSAQWDTALRAAIERCPNRRFTTYWCDRGERTDEARQLINLRQAELIKIKDADSFFQELEEKVAALEQIARPHPLSAKVAVEILKKYLVDDYYKIRLHDLVFQEVEKLYDKISIDEFPVNIAFNDKEFLQRIKCYEALTEILMSIMVVGCYWGENLHQYLWINVLNRVVNISFSSSVNYYDKRWYNLRLYPALLLLYSSGIAALAGQRYKTFAKLLIEPKVKNNLKSESIVLALYASAVIERSDGLRLPNMAQRYTPVSDYLFDLLQPFLKEIIADRDEYQYYFDMFEYLLALVHADLYQKKIQTVWGQPGSFVWRKPYIKYPDYSIWAGSINEQDDYSSWSHELKEIINFLLQEGFFESSQERFFAIEKAYQKFLVGLNWS